MQSKPDDADAHFDLGIARVRQGKLDEAVTSFRRAIALKPLFAAAHNNLGVALTDQGKLDEGAACCRRAVTLKPDYATAHYNLGNALDKQGRLEEAIGCYRRALELKPELAVAHNNLGNALRDQGKLDEAAACFGRALALNPDYAAAHANLGHAHAKQGNLDQAVSCFQRALALKPDDAEAHNNLGVVLNSLGKPTEAIVSYGRALALAPDLAEAHNNLGNAHRDQGRLDEAVACYQRALALNPDYAAAHNNLGAALYDQGMLDEASACYQRAVALEPAITGAHNNLGNVLREQGRHTEALACYERALQLQPGDAANHSNLAYGVYFCPGYDAQAIYEEQRRWDRQHAQPLAGFIRPHENDSAPERRLRIGYVSPDFRDHCQILFTVPLFSCHDHVSFEIYCFADVGAPDEATRRLQGYADEWRNIAGLTGEQVVEQIRRDKIDILVDLSMHMARNRLLVFGRKPAPVQVCWLAYPGTTGLKAMDYRLSDPYLDPPGGDVSHYSEETIRLPDTFWCYDPQFEAPGVGPLPALANDHITFGCLNNFCKINAMVLELWARVLRHVPKSRLLLLAKEGAHREATRGFLEQQGVKPDRVDFISYQPRESYLAIYHQIDIGLDTVPYNGHTTSLDSLWMGVPVITLVGPTVVGRAGLSQLSNLHLAELSADKPDQWVDTVVKLASDLPRLGALRATLRERMRGSPLMDAARFARNIENAYRDMWRRWCAR